MLHIIQPVCTGNVNVPFYAVNNLGQLFHLDPCFDKIYGSVYSPHMGRPPLNVKETKIRLSPETKERIAALVGNYQISAFIREAVENELTRREAERDQES
ncbi:hypothetical protein GR138_29910 [Shinella kummerowiae]|uniref:Uncharacterized protein n=1 Tax=Shinella kummerowiae TaxID=417745 RepID=A0A6N8SLZ4_9HYPH|nr:hypothetical protein [Shinella kummerowiae]MXN49413.1 hypothetical protein [Shinella kummerowiae]